jgi:hypothetical protein
VKGTEVSAGIYAKAPVQSRHYRRDRSGLGYCTATRQTRSWERAETLAKRLSNESAAGLAAQVEAVVTDRAPADSVMTIDQAVDLYLEDKKEQQTGKALTGKLTRLLKVRLVQFCTKEQTPSMAGVPLPGGFSLF